MYFRPLNSKCAFMNVQVINKSKHPLPAYATELSAGMDIRANLSEPITLAHIAASPHSLGTASRGMLCPAGSGRIFLFIRQRFLHGVR